MYYVEQPEIIVRPHDLQVSRGTTAELSCRMKGDPLPEIVWMQNANVLSREMLIGSNMQILPDGTLQITNIRLQDEGIYECLGRNEAGETRSQPVRVLVTDALTITNNNGGKDNRPNNNSHQSHENNIVYSDSWYEQGSEGDLQQNFNHDNNNKQEGKTFNLNSHHFPSRGESFVALSNVAPLVSERLAETEEANLNRGGIADEMPHFVTVSPDNLVVGLNADSVRLDCAATGTPTPEVQWHFNGRFISQSSLSTRLLSNGSLLIEQPVPQMAGIYRCVVANRAGWIESIVKLEVKGIPSKHPLYYFSIARILQFFHFICMCVCECIIL